MSEQIVYLAIRHDEYTKPSELNHLGIKKSTISKYCSELFKAGMLEREASEKVEGKKGKPEYQYRSKQIPLNV